MEAKLPVGGYVPKGRLAGDGQVPDKYPMIATGSKDYKSRTKLNVIESDGTLIINVGPLKTGTALMTARMAQELNKPLMVIRQPGFPDNCRYSMACRKSNSKF